MSSDEDFEDYHYDEDYFIDNDDDDDDDDEEDEDYEDSEDEDMLSISGYSSSSTDIILTDDDVMSFSDGSHSDMLENEEDSQNNGGNNESRNSRTRSRTGGNVAPIPPSRTSDVDTEMESVNGDDHDNSETEDENAFRVLPRRRARQISSDSSSENSNPLVAENTLPVTDQQGNDIVVEEIGEVVVANENSDNEMASPQESAITENVTVDIRRLPLSEISSSQLLPDQQLKTPSKLKDGSFSPKAKKNRMSPDNDDTDDGMTCSVCLDVFTNSGAHRLVSLRCGHLFGNSCVERWLKSGCMGGAKRCPTCNKRANLKDIRVIYARRLQAIDTSEKDRIQIELDKVKEEKSRLEMELNRVKLNCDMQKKQIESLTERISQLESMKSAVDDNSSVKSGDNKPINLKLVHTVDLKKNGSCRVLSYSSITGLLVASQKSGSALFPGFGIRKIDSLDLRPTIFISLHAGSIRDISFHPEDGNVLLSVSLDKTAKIFDNLSGSVVQTYKSDHFLWSCAWDVTNPHRFMTGSQNGVVKVYDRRQNNEPVSMCITSGDTTPVVSLASIPASANSVLSQGGFLSCRLNAVYAYQGTNTSSQLVMLDGPFISLNYNPTTHLILASTRPSSRHSTTRHMLNQLARPGEQTFCNNLHVFTRGSSCQLMSRSCQMMMPDDDIWVGAHNESKKLVELMSMNKDKVLHSIPVTEDVLDLCPFKMNNNFYLGSLSSNNLLVHKIY